MLIRKTANFILDFLFPINCLNCQKPGYYLCPRCSQKIERYPNKNCPFCNNISENGKVCLKCKKIYFLDQLLVFTYYSDPLIKKAIHSLKYSSVYLLARDLAQILARLIQKNLGIKEPSDSLIVPVPMHPKKQKKRGFNQTQLIGEYLSLITKIPLADKLLRKNKNTLPQMQIKEKSERKINIQKAFAVNREKLRSVSFKKQIIIVDDIVTTGATLNNCALVLKKAGFQKIVGVALARQPRRIV